MTDYSALIETLKAPPQEDITNPFSDFIDYDLDNPPQPSFLLDNLITDKITLVAGSPGVGKTTQLVPLFCKVAGLCAYDDPLRAGIRRRVIYFSEDPDQVITILHAMWLDGQLGDATKAEIKDWFRIINARRLHSHEFIERKEFMATLSNIVEHNGHRFEDMPALVFDTSSASFEMEDENSNSGVSAILSTLKTEMGGVPTVIVTHVAKALKKVEAGAMSSRGAGSWEGDVAQVCYLTMQDPDDPECNKRWLEIASGKHRFSTKWAGIEFDGQLFEYEAQDRYGNPKNVTVVYGVPKAKTRDDVVADAAQRHEEQSREADDGDRVEILAAIEKAAQEPVSVDPMTRMRLRTKVKIHPRKISAILETLIEERWVQELRFNYGKSPGFLVRLTAEQRQSWFDTDKPPVTLKDLPKQWTEMYEANAMTTEECVMSVARDLLKPPITPQYINRTSLRNRVPRTNVSVIAAINSLLDDRWLIEVEMPKSLRPNNSISNVMLPLTAEQRQQWIDTGTAPVTYEDIPVEWTKNGQAV